MEEIDEVKWEEWIAAVPFVGVGKEEEEEEEGEEVDEEITFMKVFTGVMLFLNLGINSYNIYTTWNSEFFYFGFGNAIGRTVMTTINTINFFTPTPLIPIERVNILDLVDF